MAQSPFKLFEPYGSSDKNIFFGRDAEIYALYNLLQQTRLVLIYGASGTGKTSLIHAGLPKVFNATDWYRVSIRRKDNINITSRQELARLTEQTYIKNIATAIIDLHEIRWIPIYLVFDQFEELFTLGNHEERVQFFTDLQTLLDTPLPCKIILSMREEYIGHLYEYEPLLPTLFNKRFRVEPMHDATVKEVINQMCHAGSVELEHGQDTTDQILQQIKEGKQAVHLPYLQVYLHYLYENALKTLGKPFFTEGGINAVGQLGNVLKRFIETQLEAARKHFTEQFGLPDDFAARLLDEFATDKGTKQAHKVTDLAERLGTEGGKIKEVLHYFSEAKLLRPDEDDVERYEPVHDVVAKQIHELRSVEDKEYKIFVQQLQNDYDRWLATQRLLDESDLSKVTVYEERLKKLPNFERQLVGLIDKSRQQVFFLEKRERQRRIVLIGIAMAALVGLGVAVFQYYQINKALIARDVAEKKRGEAEQKRNKTEVEKLIQQAEVDIKADQYYFANYKLIAAHALDSSNNRIDSLIKKIPKQYRQ
jgi:AAA ATPase domain